MISIELNDYNVMYYKLKQMICLTFGTRIKNNISHHNLLVLKHWGIFFMFNSWPLTKKKTFLITNLLLNFICENEHNYFTLL